MQTRFLIGLFIFLSAGILFVLVHSYVSAVGDYSLPEVPSLTLETKKDKQVEELASSNWVNKISEKTDMPFVFPATELQVKLSLESEFTAQEKDIFHIKVGALSDYQFFCINQILEAHHIRYSYYKIGENMWFSVVTKDEAYLREVLDKLKHYEITYTLSKS